VGIYERKICHLLLNRYPFVYGGKRGCKEIKIWYNLHRIVTLLNNYLDIKYWRKYYGRNKRANN
jgi:hypothetical protein